MDDKSLFYCDSEISSITILSSIIKESQEYSDSKSKQVYLLKNALGAKKDFDCANKDFAIILIPNHPIIFMHYGTLSEAEINDCFLDFKV